MIEIFFYLLFGLVPLVLLPWTSELFEFNKMILTYVLTLFIAVTWAIKTISLKKIVFRRTILDIPLIIFLAVLFLSVVASVDNRTSLLGYYSRFNGGFISYLCYALLYWAFVANLNAQKAKKALFVLFISAGLVSFYGILEHFGIDKDLWVQDVQNRVFSTLGQPNWLAIFLAALIPVAWTFALNSKLRLSFSIFWMWFFSASLFFLTLLYSKSRSGILGLVIAWAIFWAITIFASFRKKLFDKELVKKFLILNLALLIIVLAVGTPWTANLAGLIRTKNLSNVPKLATGPALEVGGTESGTIRKIVWRGAFEVWKHYPILGTGLETFAYSYYKFRPIEQNLVSEWDFLYNKAHNEYLNFMATTGTLGTMAYLFLIGTTLFLFFRLRAWAFLAGYVSILISNFFGFSVVPINLEFFLFPAIAVALANDQQTAANGQLKKLTSGQKAGIIALLLVGSWLLFVVGRYWYADTLFAKGKLYNDASRYSEGANYLSQAVNLSPSEAIFHSELSDSFSGIAVLLAQDSQKDKALEFAGAAIMQSDDAVKLSPANVNIRRTRTSLFIKLAILNPAYLVSAQKSLEDTLKLAPTDAKLYYNLGLILARLGKNDEAIETFKHTVEIKKNYKEARFALALLLAEKGQKTEARNELNYILTFIDPNDSQIKEQLEQVR